MKKAIALILIIAIVLIGGAVAGAYYYNQSTNYITTDDASVAGKLETISPPVQGKLISWSVQEGDKVHSGDVIGKVEYNKAGKQAQMDIKVENDGTIIKNKGAVGQLIAPSTPLAMVTNLSKLYVVANISENNLDAVKVGHSVDITMDAFPGTTFNGKVKQIGLATNSTFSVLPSSNNSGNYTKVTHRVPVYISIDNYQGKRVIPGLNASVKIDR